MCPGDYEQNRTQNYCDSCKQEQSLACKKVVEAKEGCCEFHTLNILYLHEVEPEEKGAARLL